MRLARFSFARCLVAVLIVLAFGLMVLPSVHIIAWVGYTDLEIEFAVSDAATGDPVPGATIQIHSEGGLCAQRQPQDFALVADGSGSARRLCKNCMCYGESGWRIDTYFVHLPDWYYRASAPGFETSEEVALESPENVRQVRRGKPAARLVVRIALTKART